MGSAERQNMYMSGDYAFCSWGGQYEVGAQHPVETCFSPCPRVINANVDVGVRAGIL